MVWLGDIPSICNGRVAETWPLERNIGGLPKETANFHKWARPAYEQGALPTLSLLPGEGTIRVVPGDKCTRQWKLNRSLCDLLFYMVSVPVPREHNPGN